MTTASSRYLHQESNVDYFLDGMLSIRVLVAEAGEPAGLEAVQKAEGLEWIWSYLTSDDLHWSRSGNDY